MNIAPGEEGHDNDRHRGPTWADGEVMASTPAPGVFSYAASAKLEDRAEPCAFIRGEGRLRCNRDWGAARGGKNLSTSSLRPRTSAALFVLDKLIKRDIAKFPVAWTVAFPDASCASPARFSPMR
jgi:hypothetical protein